MNSLQPGVDLFAAAPDGIVVVDDAGIITSVNEQAGEMFGYSSAELIERAHRGVASERFRDAHVSHRKSYSAHPTRRPMGHRLALFGRRRNGEEFPVDISLNYERSSGDQLRVIAFVRDATARKRMEEELKTTEQNFRLLVEGVGDHALLMLDPSGRVVTWNPGAQRIKGWSADAIIGRHLSAFYLPEDVAPGPSAISNAPQPKGARRARAGACVPVANDSGPRRRCRPCATPAEPCAATPRSRATAPNTTTPVPASSRSAPSTVRSSSSVPKRICCRSSCPGRGRSAQPVVAGHRRPRQLVATCAEGEGASALLGTIARRFDRDGGSPQPAPSCSLTAGRRAPATSSMPA